MQKKMIAFCGIVCNDCRVSIATQGNDRELKNKIARSWSTKKEPLRPEDIECDGCLTTGQRLFGFCRTCDVRACGLEKGVENCAHCDEYPCAKLTGLWRRLRITAARPTLEGIRDGLKA